MNLRHPQHIIPGGNLRSFLLYTICKSTLTCACGEALFHDFANSMEQNLVPFLDARSRLIAHDQFDIRQSGAVPPVTT